MTPNTIYKEPVKRAFEIEEKTNLYFFLPISYWLVSRLAALKINPNTVSIMGMMFGIGAAFSYFKYENMGYALTGLILMSLWHIFDGADGALARMTNSQSDIGKVIDGVCDYIIFTAVYVALAISMMPEYGPMIWMLVVFAGISHALQAGAYELQRQEYDYWVFDKKSAELPDINQKSKNMSHPNLLIRFASCLAQEYAKMQYRVSGLDLKYRPRLKEFMAAHPDYRDQFKMEYRREFAPVVRRWNIMSANYRTYAIFIACILEQPILYFIVELVLCNIALGFLTYAQKNKNEKFLNKINAKLKDIKSRPMVHGVILAGGQGSRFSSGMPKQYVKLAGKSIIEYSIEAYEKNEEIDQIIIVAGEEFRPMLDRILLQNSYKKITKILNGGLSRIESSFGAIKELTNDEDIIIMQDAVRPFIAQQTITDCVKATIKSHATAVVIPCTDAIMETRDGRYLNAMPKRHKLRRSFGPQGFKLGLLRTAHLLAQKNNESDFTEDFAIIQHYDLADILLVEARTDNIKVTYPEDLKIAQSILEDRSSCPPNAFQTT